MPCYNPSYKYSKGDAILCSIFHKAQAAGCLQKLIDDLEDYDLIGLSKNQVVGWWEDHQNLDKQELKKQE